MPHDPQVDVAKMASNPPAPEQTPGLHSHIAAGLADRFFHYEQRQRACHHERISSLIVEASKHL